MENFLALWIGRSPTLYVPKKRIRLSTNPAGFLAKGAIRRATLANKIQCIIVLLTNNNIICLRFQDDGKVGLESKAEVLICDSFARLNQ